MQEIAAAIRTPSVVVKLAWIPSSPGTGKGQLSTELPFLLACRQAVLRSGCASLLRAPPLRLTFPEPSSLTNFASQPHAFPVVIHRCLALQLGRRRADHRRPQ